MSNAIDRLRVRSAVRDLERDDLSLDDDEEIAADTKDTVDRHWNDDFDMGVIDAKAKRPPSQTLSPAYMQGYLSVQVKPPTGWDDI